MSVRVPVREDLAGLSPYGAPQLEAPVRLNTNETPTPPPAAFYESVRRCLGDLELNRYPDRQVTRLRERLAAVEELDASQVWVANGSNEVLLHLLLAYGGPGRHVLVFRPGYSAHPLIARVAGATVITHDLDDRFRLDPARARTAVGAHDPDVVVVAHPNNPTGLPVPTAAIRALHDAGRALVIVDEAYIEFGGETARGLVNSLPRLAVTRTFSKAYRLAGLRLGYLLAPEWVVEDLKRVRLPYHVDTIKQVAARAALDLGASMLDHVADVTAERDRLHAALAQLDGVTAWPSVANFVLFRAVVDRLFERLLDRGVLVRDFSGEPRLGGCLRVTVGTREENDAFLAALDAVLAEDTARDRHTRP